MSICNAKLGTPYERCQRVFEDAVVDCKAKLGPFFGNACSITYVVGTICLSLKPLDLICIMVADISDAIVEEVRTSMMINDYVKN